MTSYIPFKLLRTGFNKNTKLLVQDTKKLPQDVSYLRGRMVKFIRCIGNMVNVYDTRNVKKYIPLEYVLSYEEYTVTSNPTLFDTMFIVVAKNDYDFQIGAVFETTVMSCGNDLIFYTDNNERITLHSSWVKTISAPAKTAKIQDLVEKFNPQVVQEIPLEIAVTTTTPVIETELEVEEPSESSLSVFNFVSKDVHPFEMFKDNVEELLSEEGVYYDISGTSHKTLIECLKRNQYFIDVSYLTAVSDITSTLLQGKEDE